MSDKLDKKAAGAVSSPPPRGARLRAPSSARALLVLVGVNVVIMAVLTSLSPTFLTYGNLSAVMLRMSELAMLAIAETIVLIAGGFDLTIGVVMALAGAICSTLYAAGLPFWAALCAALLAGAAVGLVNGFFVVVLRLQPFIVTLATMTILRSAVYALMRGNVLTAFPDSYLELAYVYVLKVPLLFVVVLVVAALAVLLLRRTSVGRRIFAVGANPRAAFISGVHVDRVQYLVYALSGLLSALAGLMFTVRIRAIMPDAGLNSPLEVITAVLIGGTSMSGGKGSVLGSLLGILAMYLLVNGFNLLGLNPFWEVIILGAILIYVVGQDNILRGLRAALRRGGSRGPRRRAGAA